MKAQRERRKEGFALLLSLIALTILAVLVADLHETTGTNFAAAMAERDQLRAEYLAKSGINLTRMLIAQERVLRQLPTVRMVWGAVSQGRPVPQIPVWQFANAILKPFANFEESKEDAEGAGFDLDLSEGLGKTGGSFEILATAENGKMNVNDPRLSDGELSKMAVAPVLFQLLASPKFDPLFSELDEKGRTNTRNDLVANVIDWWDLDEQRTNYDPTLNAIQSSGGEDNDYYRAQAEPYSIKGAPFDTLEELRLVRGISDDVWATFIEPDVEDPSKRQVTVWGANSSINPNQAEPAVLLARVCAFPEFHPQLLCTDPTGLEPGKFVSLLSLVRSFGIPAFSGRSDFVNFVLGKPTGMMATISKFMSGGMGSALGGGGGGTSGATSKNADDSPETPFKPLVIPPNAAADLRPNLEKMFTTTSKMFTIESIGRVGHSQRRIRTVINIDQQWTPPKPNAGQMPPLGIFSYYRIE